MGIGMVLIVAPDQVDAVAKHFTRIGQKFYFIGNVVKGDGRVRYDAPPAGFASWIE
jgi:phosphoribosylaminoimidazole (AIR) synthetase